MPFKCNLQRYSVESVARLGAGGGGDGELFADFTGCVLGDLMYVLQDSLVGLYKLHPVDP